MSWESALNTCPVCTAHVEAKEGHVSKALVCEKCGAELVIRPKHLKTLVYACAACAFLLALAQRLEVPDFVVAFPVYTGLLLLGLRQFVFPFLPHELRSANRYIQSLQLGGDSPRNR